MEFLSILALGILAILVVQLIRIFLSDCDLTLQWASRFGKSTDVLRGKVVWITGASSGIGEYLAYELAAAGCRLVLSARREEELDRVKKQCLLSGRLQEEDVLVLPLDILNFDSHPAAVQRILTSFRKIDILVNNAGRSQRAAWEKVSIEVDRQVLELNVLGTLSVTKSVLPHMMDQGGGHIVVTSSVAGKLGAPMSASYTGSKHALHGWFETLRIEGYDKNIEVTMLCPGPVFSNLLSVAFTDTAGKDLKGAMNPVEKRMSTARCAQLSALAIANKLDEAWIARHPVLLFLYAFQYMPSLARRLAVKLGMKQIRKIREGQQDC